MVEMKRVGRGGGDLGEEEEGVVELAEEALEEMV